MVVAMGAVSDLDSGIGGNLSVSRVWPVGRLEWQVNSISLENWCLVCDLLAIGFCIGLIVGDVCDKCDPIHWKYKGYNDETA